MCQESFCMLRLSQKMGQCFSIHQPCPKMCGAAVIYLNLHYQDDVQSLLCLLTWQTLVLLCAPWWKHVRENLWGRFIYQARGHLWTSVRSLPFINKCPPSFVGQLAYFIQLSTASQKKLLSVRGNYCQSTQYRWIYTSISWKLYIRKYFPEERKHHS